MAEDPIVEETRRLREEMLEEAGGDLDGLFAYLQKQQEIYGQKLVRLPPRNAIPMGTPANKSGR